MCSILYFMHREMSLCIPHSISMSITTMIAVTLPITWFNASFILKKQPPIRRDSCNDLQCCNGSTSTMFLLQYFSAEMHFGYAYAVVAIQRIIVRNEQWTQYHAAVIEYNNLYNMDYINLKLCCVFTNQYAQKKIKSLHCVFTCRITFMYWLCIIGEEVMVGDVNNYKTTIANCDFYNVSPPSRLVIYNTIWYILLVEMWRAINFENIAL